MRAIRSRTKSSFCPSFFARKSLPSIDLRQTAGIFSAGSRKKREWDTPYPINRHCSYADATHKGRNGGVHSAPKFFKKTFRPYPA